MPVYEVGFHKSIAVATTSTVITSALTPGYYTLIAKGCNCHVDGGALSAVTVSTTHTYIPDGWGYPLKVRDDQSNGWVVVKSDALATGTLHINKHSDVV